MFLGNPQLIKVQKPQPKLNKPETIKILAQKQQVTQVNFIELQ